MFGDEKQSLFYNPLSSLPLRLRPARSCSRRERRGDPRGRLPARPGRGRQRSYPSGREPPPPAAPRLPPPPLRSTARTVARSLLRLLLGARRTLTPRSRVEESAGTSPRKLGKFPRAGWEPSVRETQPSNAFDCARHPAVTRMRRNRLSDTLEPLILSCSTTHAKASPAAHRPQLLDTQQPHPAVQRTH
ncbi:hypothetical protein NN561_010167 [Cricetulus griseus]